MHFGSPEETGDTDPWSFKEYIHAKRLYASAIGTEQPESADIAKLVL